MATEPLPVRLPNPSAQPFVTALKTVRFFSVIFFWVTMVALLAHVAVFVLAQWVGLYDEPAAAPMMKPASTGPASPGLLGLLENRAMAAEPAAEPPPAEAPAAPAEAFEPPEPPAESPAIPPPAPEEREAAYYRDLTATIMGPLRALGLLAGMLLLVSMFIYLQIGLLGRLAGIRQMTNALFLMLLFLATAIPWHNWFSELDFGSFYTFDEFLQAREAHLAAASASLQAGVLYYGRFLAMPLVSLLLLALSGIQFGRSYGASVLANE